MNSNVIIKYLKFYKENYFINNKKFLLNFDLPLCKKLVKFTLLIDLFLIILFCMQHDFIFRLLIFIEILYNTYLWFAYKKYINLKATLYNTVIFHNKFAINMCIIIFIAINWLLIDLCNKSNNNYFFINHFGFYMILIPLLIATISLIVLIIMVSRKKNEDLLEKYNKSDDESKITKIKSNTKMIAIIITTIMLPISSAIIYGNTNYDKLSIIIAILDFIVNLFMFMLVYIISFMYIFRHQIFNQEDYEKEYITQQDRENCNILI